MDIREALGELGAFITMVTDSGFLSDGELKKIEAVESAIHAYVCEKGDM
jgi:hypothetical protein